MRPRRWWPRVKRCGGTSRPAAAPTTTRRRALAPGAPADLAALCDRLLEGDPAGRATGAEVLAVLEPAPAGRAPVTVRRDEPTEVVGREPELAALAAALDDVRSGQGARLLL